MVYKTNQYIFVNALTIKKKANSLIQEEVGDLAERLNDVELDIAEAKEFSHLSSEVFVILQKQINELKYLLAVLVLPKDNFSKDSQGIYL